MKLWEILRFELEYQSRRAWTWMYAVALMAISFQIATQGYTENARAGGYFFNAPFVIASITLLASAMALLVTAALAGDAAARDVQTGMHPLLYTCPVGKANYLAGRFLAAFGLNALILVSVQAALLLSTVMPGLPPELLGPFQPRAYVSAYLVIALPNAFVATALSFSMAALSRRAIAGYLGSVLLFFASVLIWQFLAVRTGQWELARILDPLGMTILSEVSRSTTPVEKNTLSTVLNGSLYLNRAVWLGIATVVFALAHKRFRFDCATTRPWWRRTLTSAGGAPSGVTPPVMARSGPILVPRVERRFGFSTRTRQTLATAAHSFRHIALSWGGLVLAGLATILVGLGPRAMHHMGVPLLPTTQQMTGFVGNSGEILWIIVPLLTVFYVGELVWRDRETGLSDISDAAPVPEWVRLLGRFLGLGLVFVGYQALILAACVLVQVQLGYHDFEIGLYARILFGLQLADHLLFGLLAFAVHVLVNQKYVGHLVVLMAYGLTAFSSALGIEHNLLVYGSAPAWSYSDLRGFGPSVAPWMAFKLYWGAWALLLAVAAKLFWVRGREHGLASRIKLARRRLRGLTLAIAVVGAVVIVMIGGFLFYNTNLLNAYDTPSARATRRAEYERRYGQYEGIPEPRLTGVTLRVEIYPDRREAEIRGTYRLVNLSGVPIDSVHLAPESEVETGPADFDRRATLALDDQELGHRIYTLQTPLLPGDSMQLSFTVRFKPQGFTNDGIDPSVAGNGTFFEGNDWLPAVGYQPDRALAGVGERRAHGLPARPGIRPLDDPAARRHMAGPERVAFEAVVGTAEGQVAVAPGRLRRTWMENGRRYFHYTTDAPIRNDFALYSAAYAVREARWRNPSSGSRQVVTIQILHHLDHGWNLDRIVRSVQASLDHFTRHFGPYPYGQIRLVEHPGKGNTLHSAPVNISYEEGFSLLKPEADPRKLDFPFAVVAHEVAHQWWGNQLSPADAEGGALLTESLAWYSAMSVVQAAYGDEHLERLLRMLREAYHAPRSRADVPLLRARDQFHAYRKGPFALYALRQYVGAERIDTALRHLFEQHRAAVPPLPTSLDLYRELQAVTPDSLQYLLVDLFERNTFWNLEATQVAAEEAGAGTWEVTLDVRARKVVVDTTGAETEIRMNDLVEVGVFAAEKDAERGGPLYLGRHRLRSGAQRITVRVSGQPSQAGIDPRNLLIDVKPADNLKGIRRDR